MMIKEFRINYGELTEAVLVNLNFKYPDHDDAGTMKIIRIVLECKNILKGYQYEQIELVFENVKSFKLFEDNFTHQVVGETQYEMINEMFAFDFSCNNAWQNIEELKSSSDFYIVCKNFSYKVKR